MREQMRYCVRREQYACPNYRVEQIARWIMNECALKGLKRFVCDLNVRVS